MHWGIVPTKNRIRCRLAPQRDLKGTDGFSAKNLSRRLPPFVAVLNKCKSLSSRFWPKSESSEWLSTSDDAGRGTAAAGRVLASFHLARVS